MTLYEQVTEALQDRVLTVVSERTGINTVTLAQIKKATGNPNKSTLNVLATYLKIKGPQN